MIKNNFSVRLSGYTSPIRMIVRAAIIITKEINKSQSNWPIRLNDEDFEKVFFSNLFSRARRSASEVKLKPRIAPETRAAITTEKDGNSSKT